MAVNMARWRVQSNNLYLPYADLDTAGNVGRQLLIPDDVDLTLAYLVGQGPLGFRTIKTDQNGILLQSGVSTAYTQGYTTTQILAGSATVVVTIPFISVIQFIFNLGSAIRLTLTNAEFGYTETIQIATAASSSNSFRTSSISVLNTTATQTTFTITAFAP